MGDPTGFLRHVKGLMCIIYMKLTMWNYFILDLFFISHQGFHNCVIIMQFWFGHVVIVQIIGINTLHIRVLQDNHTSQEFDVGRAQSAMKACLQCAHSRIPAMYGSLVIQPPK